MTINTKILKYDLDRELQDTFNQLDQLRAQQVNTSLFEILSNINATMLGEDEKKAVLDLITSYNRTDKTISERVNDLENRNGSVEDLIEGNTKEVYEYNSDGEIVKQTSTGDRAFVTEYLYGPLIPKGSSVAVSGVTVLTGSRTRLKSSDGTDVIINKTYAYDNNENIVEVTTSTNMDITAPSSVTSVTTTITKAGVQTLLNVNWLNPTDADFSHVNVYLREKASGIIYGLNSKVKNGATQFNISSLDKNVDFEVVLKTVDNAGNEQDTGILSRIKTPTE